MTLVEYSNMMKPIVDMLGNIDHKLFPEEFKKRCEDHNAITKILHQYIDKSEKDRLEAVAASIFKDL